MTTFSMSPLGCSGPCCPNATQGLITQALPLHLAHQDRSWQVSLFEWVVGALQSAVIGLGTMQCWGFEAGGGRRIGKAYVLDVCCWVQWRRTLLRFPVDRCVEKHSGNNGTLLVFCCMQGAICQRDLGDTRFSFVKCTTRLDAHVLPGYSPIFVRQLLVGAVQGAWGHFHGAPPSLQ